MIYFDNAATGGFKASAVLDAAVTTLKYLNANPGRSGHRLALAGAKTVIGARMAVQELFNAEDADRVIFTKNTTEALNLALIGTAEEDGHIVTTVYEHNSVLRTLTHLKERFRIGYTVADGTPEAIAAAMKKNTYLVAVNHVSNVTGREADAAAIGKIAREKGALFLLDAAQSAGVLPVDMEADHIDYLCVPGHKGLYGPMGTGMLLCGPDTPLPTLMEGGTGSQSLLLDQPEELPDRLESGTVNTPGICGLRAGMEWVMKMGVDRIGRHEIRLMAMLYDRIGSIPGLRLYTPRPRLEAAAPVLSLNIDGLSSEETGARLDRMGIAVRPGLHCAPSAHRQWGTVPDGTVRLAPSAFTTEAQIEKTAYHLWEIARKPLQ